MANTSISPENDASVSPTGQNGKGAASLQGRRIVKAATPKIHEGTNGGSFSFSNPAKIFGSTSPNDNDGELVHHKKGADDLDDDEKWRMERMKTTEKRGKALREKELQARRQTESAPQANASGNPFSRFLSAFSVASKYPEHKRSLEAALDEDVGPSEKRLKQSEVVDPYQVGEASNESVGDEQWTLFSSKFFWITTAITVVIGVVLAVQRGHKK